MRCQHLFRVEVFEMLVEVGIAFYSSPRVMVQWKTMENGFHLLFLSFLYSSAIFVPFSTINGTSILRYFE